MTYKIFVGGKFTRVIMNAPNKRIAVEMFLKSDYGKYAPPSQVKAVPLSQTKQGYNNPPSAQRIKMARVAYKLSYKLYKHFKLNGIPSEVIKRIPESIRPYVLFTLQANDVPIRNGRKKISKADAALILSMLKLGLD